MGGRRRELQQWRVPLCAEGCCTRAARGEDGSCEPDHIRWAAHSCAGQMMSREGGEVSEETIGLALGGIFGLPSFPSRPSRDTSSSEYSPPGEVVPEFGKFFAIQRLVFHSRGA